MKVLYIGQYSYGTTSRMRGEIICQSKFIKNFSYIDTNIPYLNTNRLIRTLGFRFKIGPLIKSINNFIINNLQSRDFDLIWIDKGVYITLETLSLLRKRTKHLVHYTPDTAFFHNRSALFEKGIHLYDFLISTKSFDEKNYLKLIESEKLLLTTQGYDNVTHKPYTKFSEKEDSIVFIGLNEPSREEIISSLLKAGMTVKLAGYGWKKFVNKNRNDKLIYLGEKLLGEAYAKAISGSIISIGALSKKFPELHTTRTFEIPACGTALLTERNKETTAFFNENEAIFYSDRNELIEKTLFYRNNKKALQDLTCRGASKVIPFNYESIISNLLSKIVI